MALDFSKFMALSDDYSGIVIKPGVCVCVCVCVRVCTFVCMYVCILRMFVCRWSELGSCWEFMLIFPFLPPLLHLLPPLLLTFEIPEEVVEDDDILLG